MECDCREGEGTWRERAASVMKLSKLQKQRTRRRGMALHLRLHFIDRGYRILSS